MDESMHIFARRRRQNGQNQKFLTVALSSSFTKKFVFDVTEVMSFRERVMLMKKLILSEVVFCK